MCEIIENLSFDYKIYIFNFFNSHKIQETVDSLIKKKCMTKNKQTFL